MHDHILSYRDKLSVSIWIKVSLIVTIVIVTYRDAVISLINTWSDRPAYSHGFLVPFISLYIIYHNKEELLRIARKPNLVGGAILTIISCFILIVGKISSTEAFLHLSILLVIPALVLMHLGNEYLRKMIFPLLYLIFMIPIMDVFLVKFQWPFQIYSANMASALLNLLNIPTIVDKQIIHLPNAALEVAKACSGVRFFVSILAVGIPLAYLTQKTLRRKIILILFGIAIVIPVNIIRITIIGVWSHNGGDVLHGPFHILQGLFVAIVGFILLMLMAYILNVIPLKTVKNEKPRMKNIPHQRVYEKKDFNKPWIISYLLLLITFGYMITNKPLNAESLSYEIKLPDQIGSWRINFIDPENNLFNSYSADMEVNRSYKNDKNHTINLYIGYFESQKRNKELVNYKLNWLYENAQETNVLLSRNKLMKVNKTIYKNGTDKELAHYWYDLNGKTVTSNIMVKIRTAINGLMKRHTNGMVIVISSALKNESEMKSVLEYETDFIKELYRINPNPLI